MDLKEYMYNYTNIYFTNEVKKIICAENYTGADADNNYVDFIKRYEIIFKLVKDKKFSDEKIIEAFHLLSKTTVKEYNDFMKNCLENTLKENLIDFEKKWNSIENDISNFMSVDKVNENLVNEIREIEEKYI